MTNKAQAPAPLETRATAGIMVNIPLDEWNETRADIKELHNDIKALKAQKSTEYLTVNQAAAFLKIGRGTVYSYINNKKLKSSKIGKKTLIRQSDLDEALKNGAV